MILFVLVGIVVIRFFLIGCWSRWTKVRCAVIKAVNWNVTKACCSSNTHTNRLSKHQLDIESRTTIAKKYWVIEWLKIWLVHHQITRIQWLLFFLVGYFFIIFFFLWLNSFRASYSRRSHTVYIEILLMKTHNRCAFRVIKNRFQIAYALQHTHCNQKHGVVINLSTKNQKISIVVDTWACSLLRHAHRFIQL